MLKSARSFVRNQITRNFNVKGTIASCDNDEKARLKLKYEGWVHELQSYNSKIQNLLWNDDDSNENNESVLHLELKKCEEYSDKLNELLNIIKLNNTSPLPSNNDIDTARSVLRSPTAPLPVFKSLEGEDIERFLREFEDTCSHFKYTERDKFLLLRQQISGRASLLLDSLEIDRQSYLVGKKLLTEALASSDLKKYNVLSKLCKLELSPDMDPFAYRCQFSNISESFTKLSINVNDVLQFFVWKGLSQNFKSHLVSITNKERPSFEEIKDNYFQASERYMLANKVNKSNKSKVNVSSDNGSCTNMAVSVKTESKSGIVDCVLCSHDKINSNHKISKCSKYDNPKSKITKLTEMGACLKCTRPNHSATKCKFKLKTKCFKCNSWHFSYLCDKIAD